MAKYRESIADDDDDDFKPAEYAESGIKINTQRRHW